MNNFLVLQKCNHDGLHYSLQFTQKSYKKCDFDYIFYGLYAFETARYYTMGLYIHTHPDISGNYLVGGVFSKNRYSRQHDIFYKKSYFVEDMLNLLKASSCSTNF